MEGIIEEEKNDLKNILIRLRRRDFSGNSGQAIRNSTYNLVTILLIKFSGLIFTIIIARMLMPELFGLYGLALSTIALFASFSDLGLSTTLLAYVSKKHLEKNLGKAKGYYDYLLKIKLILLFIVSFILLSSSYFIANYYYNKPIFLALLAGALYVFISEPIGFILTTFVAMNDFKIGLIKESVFQGLKLILVPLMILLTIEKVSSSNLLFLIFLLLSLIYAISGLVILIRFRNTEFKKTTKDPLTKEEKRDLFKFTIPMILTVFSGMFFGNIDMIMLGRFVTSDILGYYQSALSLIGSASAIITFSAISLFPILSGLKGRELERGFSKSMKLVFLIALASGVFTFLFADIIIDLVYGSDFSEAAKILRLFSLILFTAPLIGLYNTYYISQKRTKEYALLLIFSTIVNIVLNYLFIIALLPSGMIQAAVGAATATLISRVLYLGGLIFFKKKYLKATGF